MVTSSIRDSSSLLASLLGLFEQLHMPESYALPFSTYGRSRQCVLKKSENASVTSEKSFICMNEVALPSLCLCSVGALFSTLSASGEKYKAL